MAQIRLDNLHKSFERDNPVIKDVTLTIPDGEFVVLVGPSGCGKSTLLRMIAGLESISSGTLVIGDQLMNDVPPPDRNLAMVFQNYALYPHLSVEENIGFSLILAGERRSKYRELVAAVAESLGLEELLRRRPRELSGGQKQRVAIGRAIIRNPVAFLMDEPLSNLDAKLRVQMRGMLRDLHTRIGATTVYVTHDQVEAMTLGDRVAVLKPITSDSDESLQQVGPPRELYARPANLFVATFIGNPQMNIVSGTFDPSQPDVMRIGSSRLPIPSPLDPASTSNEIALGIRPSSLGIGQSSDEGLQGTISRLEHLGNEVLAHLRIESELERWPAVAALQATDQAEGRSGSTVVAVVDVDFGGVVGDEVSCHPVFQELHLFNALTGERIPTHVDTDAVAEVQRDDVHES